MLALNEAEGLEPEFLSQTFIYIRVGIDISQQINWIPGEAVYLFNWYLNFTG